MFIDNCFFLLVLTLLMAEILNTFGDNSSSNNDVKSSTMPTKPVTDDKKKKCPPMFLLLFIIKTSTAYHRNWGPVLLPFTPGLVPIKAECDQSNRPCLELTSRKICKEKLSQPLLPWLPLPWWYFFCRMVTGPRIGGTVRTTSRTIHPYFRETVDKLIRYRKKNRVFDY